MRTMRYRYVWAALASIILMTMAGCKFTEKQAPAPITGAGTDIGGTSGTLGGSAQAVYHTVQAGESLYRISLKYNQNWQDIATWNNISDPSAIAVGTVLLVSPTAGAAGTPSAEPGIATVEPEVAAGVEGRMQWGWPASGAIIGKFDGGDNKGIKISGKAGDSVMAAADGRVAYVGSGLRGYGNLVIVKHNDVFVTAYAHNQKIVVQENQVVKKGEKIAEMGNTDASQVMLHFEVRQQNQSGSHAVDPLKYLPAK